MKPLLAPFANLLSSNPPLWLMRQAGRYLPEYKITRKKAGSFLDLCYNSELAKEVTLQPITRFGFDGAILFSDILVIPDILGQQVSFKEGEGPVLGKLDFAIIEQGLEQFASAAKIITIQDIIIKTKRELPATTTMIGFVGSPWTLACYMLSGGVDKEYMPARVGAWSGAEDFVKLIDILVAACVHLASAHIKAGAEIIQLFDSWAGLLHGEAYVKYVIEANNRVVSKLKQLHPATPIIVFPRGSGIRYKQFAEQTLADGLGLDQNVDPAWAVENLPERLVLQGNLDPAILLTNPEIIAGEVKKMREHFQGRKYIANLGHGISQHTPINNVEAFITAIRK